MKGRKNQSKAVSVRQPRECVAEVEERRNHGAEQSGAERRTG